MLPDLGSIYLGGCHRSTHEPRQGPGSQDLALGLWGLGDLEYSTRLPGFIGIFQGTRYYKGVGSSFFFPAFLRI